MHHQGLDISQSVKQTSFSYSDEARRTVRRARRS